MPAIVPPTWAGCVLTTGPGRASPEPHAAESTEKQTSRVSASFIVHLSLTRTARCAPLRGFGAFPNTSTMVAVTPPVFLKCVLRAALQVQHLPLRHFNRAVALDCQQQLPRHERKDMPRRIVVRVHATGGARLGVVAQDPELRLLHHDHRRDAGIAGYRSRFFGAADGLGIRGRRREDKRQHRAKG